MTRDRLQGIIAGVTFVAAIAMSAMAQEGAAAAETATAAQAAAPAGTVPAVGTTYADSNETREALRVVLDKYPPQVAKVLKLDPSLFANSAYLANYPALAAFVAQHPEVAHSPAFFLEGVWLPTDAAPESATERLWRDTMQGLAIFMVMFLVTGTLVWLIRTLIEHRRWSRLTRTQAEVHGKLMDRFSSNEELLAYMQTPGGKRFLESAPIMVDAGPRAVSAPIGRMLGSMQIGVILAAGGLGLQYVSRSIDKTVSQPLLAIGVLAVAIGAGFLLSAVVSFVLSKRLGLIDTGTASRAAAEAPSATD
jgi:hypothetical protein